MKRQPKIPINQLARAYCSAVRAGHLSQDSASRHLADAADYILRHGVDSATPEVLRVTAAMAEAVAELKDERRRAPQRARRRRSP